MTTPLEPEVQAHLDAGDITGMEHATIDERRRLLSADIDRMFRLFGLPGPDVAQRSRSPRASRRRVGADS